MKPVILTPRAWRAVRKELHTEYPKTVFMIRGKMRSVLGFTVREHRRWESEGEFNEHDYGRYIDEIHLDFYSENKRTMFLLKFSDLINIVENEK